MTTLSETDEATALWRAYEYILSLPIALPGHACGASNALHQTSAPNRLVTKLAPDTPQDSVFVGSGTLMANNMNLVPEVVVI
ncbi:MAG: hypothetical protein HC853_04830 [Anaerolineae bacterium]|nr:hypothetical protein [Anaerolineae bacterium]